MMVFVLNDNDEGDIDDDVVNYDDHNHCLLC